jgi:mRNA-degrading endonuclease RelE of RelBE toxin-antitoxin system
MDLLAKLISRVRGNAPAGSEVFLYEHQYVFHLNSLWGIPEVSPESAPDRTPPEPKSDDTPLLSRKPPDPLDWKLAFTTEFNRAITPVDRSMQGRVLLALAELSSAPTEVKGNTVKPLTGDKAGLWRYRIGDYRLIYQPDQNTRLVVLVGFSARGDAYEG